MLRRASLEQIKNGSVHREPGRDYLVVAMRVYPRFLKKSFIDEYQQSLSPEPGLFKEYRELCVRYENHEKAFDKVNYEERFWLDEKGLENLARLSALSTSRDVHLICRCGLDEHCHVDLMLLMAERLYGAPIAAPAHQYPRFRSRLG